MAHVVFPLMGAGLARCSGGAPTGMRRGRGKSCRKYSGRQLGPRMGSIGLGCLRDRFHPTNRKAPDEQQ
ncbi:Hypothetical protein AA314_06368 [Archangium gephyra]|uniref:Uncharacterized protein n=1 Tax=Archangium gephyra TaxID=48 RepID=A0AAC8TG43_9BACT|nr:Hypothetical protein AA314_06368 [Archangium gephyra]